MDMYAENYTDVDPFVKNLRDSLKRSYDTGVSALNQQRMDDQAKIMSQANKAGMMYSNLPARSKIQYDTQSYYPALTKLHNTYQTGLDSIRSQGVSLANQIKAYEEQIADYNEYASMYDNA